MAHIIRRPRIVGRTVFCSDPNETYVQLGNNKSWNLYASDACACVVSDRNSFFLVVVNEKNSAFTFCRVSVNEFHLGICIVMFGHSSGQDNIFKYESVQYIGTSRRGKPSGPPGTLSMLISASQAPRPRR